MADEKDIPKDTPEITEEKPVCGFSVLCGNGGYKLSFLSGEIVQREPSIDEAIVAMKTVILNIETDWVAYKFVSALKRLQSEELINKSVVNTLKKGSIN